MSTSNPNPPWPIRQYDGAAIGKKRRYTPKSSWDHIKPFVSEEIKKGTPHKTIIADLGRRGINIEENQFKRLVKDLGLSDRNLQQRHRKHIFQIERRALKKGIEIRRWRFTDTRQVVKKSQLDRILRSDGKEFEDVVSSPGMLAPSPLDTLESMASPLDTNPDTHVGESEGPTMGTCNYAIQDRLPTHDEENTPAIPSPSPQSEPQYNVASEGISEATNPADTKPHKTGAEGLETLESKTATEPGIVNESILQSFCDDLQQCIESTLKESPCTPDQDILDTLTPQELVEYLSQVFRQNLKGRMDSQINIAKEYLSVIDSLQRELNISRKQAETSVFEHMYSSKMPTEQILSVAHWESSSMPVYKYCEEIKLVFIENRERKQPSPEMVKIYNEILLPYFYANIRNLWKSVGSESATFRSRSGDKIVFDDFDRMLFREYVCHLPYVWNELTSNPESEYGNFFLLSHALKFFLDFSRCYDTNLCRSSVSLGSKWSGTQPPARPIEVVLELLLYSRGILAGNHDEPAVVHTIRSVNDYIDGIERGVTFSRNPTSMLIDNIRTAVDSYGRDIRTTTAILQYLRFVKYFSDCMLVQKAENHIFSQREEAVYQSLVRNAKEFNHRAAACLKQTPPLHFPSDISTISVVVEAAECAIDMRLPGTGLRVLSLAKDIISTVLQELPKLDSNRSEVVRLSATCWSFQEAQAIIHLQLGDCLKAIESLRVILHCSGTNTRFFENYGKNVTDSLVATLTARGLVRYTEPMLERVLRVCEQKNNPEQNPFYRSLLFAVGSAAFRLYIEDNKPVVSRITPFADR
ncbi:hypothetical protein TWF481_005091 [Arthrobotrys musiformis]|uniref:Clr5 domain-containing protein n=1 Tax=Arthrobotrys musiformis TaxID=47236 RepID=A0AAV9WEW5_9PEZI